MLIVRKLALSEIEKLSITEMDLLIANKLALLEIEELSIPKMGLLIVEEVALAVEKRSNALATIKVNEIFLVSFLLSKS